MADINEAYKSNLLQDTNKPKVNRVTSCAKCKLNDGKCSDCVSRLSSEIPATNDRTPCQACRIPKNEHNNVYHIYVDPYKHLRGE